MKTTETAYYPELIPQEKENENRLYPVFLKLEELRLLIVGGGNVALEKLNSVLTNSPDTQVTLVAQEIFPEIIDLSKEFTNVVLYEREFQNEDLDEIDLVFIAVNDFGISEEITNEAHSRNLLVNVADTPGLCDFYLGSVVKKGDLKIAISTNGKSPTLSKRLREVLTEAIPDETQLTIEQLNELRSHLKGPFKEKVSALNKATAVLVEKQDRKKYRQKKIRIGILYGLSVIALLITGHLLFTYIPFHTIGNWAYDGFSQINSQILLWILAGVLAQLIDGSMGMAYGVTTTTFLMTFGISPAVASASMHASEIFTTGTSSLVYLRYRNINGKLFRTLLIPGAVGAIVGACTISLLKPYLGFVKPVISVYTLLLGVLIIRKALGVIRSKRKKIRHVGPLAATGGFLDSVGGGGWGPIVTSTLVAGGRDLRYSIGSAHAAKFFIAVVSTITFFFMIGIHDHWQIILGLVIGGMAAAPFSIWLSTKISIRNGLILVGLLIIITSLKIIIETFL
ncbi:MAG TPA: TSUP family transporter [Bacteroidia bacterium]|nr:TSUP family transporter [Bacteroidia bacterium]